MTEAAAAALQHRLVKAHEVFGFFLDFDVAVAQDAEEAARGDGVTREQLVMIDPDDAFERDEPRLLAAIGQPHETLKLRGDRKEGGHRLAVDLMRQTQRHDEAEIGDERKRMRGVDRERRQDREDLIGELVIKPCAVLARQRVGFDHHDAGIGQRGAQFAPGLLLIGDQLGRHGIDARELLGRRQPVVGQRGDTGVDHAFEAGDAHHVEFVEVRRRDGKKAQPLQHGVTQVLRLLQNAAVEGKPGQFAVDEPSR